MAVFRIGQRVRFARHLFGPRENARYIGSEGFIATDLREWTEGRERVLVHVVQMTTLTAPLPPNWRGSLSCMPAELDPVVDDGRQVIAWKDCAVWQPRRIRENEPA